jgi:PilZ domain
MSTLCTVVIGAVELLETVRQNVPADSEVLTFSDTEPLKALEAITARRPNVIALERLFAATSRGAALINRIKADPSLTNAEIRVVSVDGTYRVSPRRAPAPPGDTPPAPPAPDDADVQLEVVPTTPAPSEGAATQNFDYRGTRRAPRFRMAQGTEAQVDGVMVTVVDLSRHGAQILCPIPLKPQQRVRMILGDDLGLAKFSASVAWASFEIPKGVSRYRAGVEFNDAEVSAIDAFCMRHKS